MSLDGKTNKIFSDASYYFDEFESAKMRKIIFVLTGFNNLLFKFKNSIYLEEKIYLIERDENYKFLLVLRIEDLETVIISKVDSLLIKFCCKTQGFLIKSFKRTEIRLFLNEISKDNDNIKFQTKFSKKYQIS